MCREEAQSAQAKNRDDQAHPDRRSRNVLVGFTDATKADPTKQGRNEAEDSG
jgi:hypothetical protein